MEKLGDLMAATGDRLSAVKEQQDKQAAAGGTPDLWTQWGEILNQDLLDMESDLNDMGRLLDPQFALKVVAKASRAWAVVGLILKRVKRYELWSGMGYKSYPDFCQRVLGKSVVYCNNTIRGAQVCLDLARAGFDFIPTCQAQAVEMAKIVSQETGRPGLCPTVLREKWQQILDAAKEQCQNITAPFISAIANPDKPKKSNRRVQLNPSTWDLVERRAAAAGMDPTQWLEKLIRQQESDEAIEPASPEQEQAWQRDMSQLVEEQDPWEPSERLRPFAKPMPTDLNFWDGVLEGVSFPQREERSLDDAPQLEDPWNDPWLPERKTVDVAAAQVQQVHHSDGTIAPLPTLFDVEQYTTPAPPAPLVEDGPQEPWEPSPVQLTIYDALDSRQSPPGRIENNEGDTRRQSPGEDSISEGLRPSSIKSDQGEQPFTRRQKKDKRGRSRRTLGAMFGWGSSSYSPAPGGAT